MEAARGVRPHYWVVNKGSFYKQTLEPFLRNVHDGVRAELFGTITVFTAWSLLRRLGPTHKSGLSCPLFSKL